MVPQTTNYHKYYAGLYSGAQGSASPLQKHFRGWEEVELILWSGWGSVWGDIICRQAQRMQKAAAVRQVCCGICLLVACHAFSHWLEHRVLSVQLHQNQRGQRVIKHSNINSAFSMLGLPSYSNCSISCKCQLLSSSVPCIIIKRMKILSISPCAEENETTLAASN